MIKTRLNMRRGELRPSTIIKALVFSICGLGLASWVMLDTAATALTARSAQATLGLVPRDAGAVTKAIDERIVADAGKSPVTRQEAARLRDALRARPLMPVALRLLADFDETRGKTASARDAMDLSARLSRRDILTQLWLIEDAVSANRVSAALSHYDIALRSSTAASPLLYPILASAISDVQIRHDLVAYRDAPWMPAFATYAAGKAEPRAAASLVLSMPGLGKSEESDAIRSGVLARLTAAGDIDGAYRFARALPSSDLSVLNDLRFSTRTTANGLTPLVWQLTQSSEITAVPADGGRLLLNVLGDGTTVAARRFVVLGASRHSLGLATGRTDAGMANGLRWAWACYSAEATSGAPIARSNGDAPSGTEILPEGCAVVELALMVSGSGQSGDVTVDPPRISAL